MDDLVKEALDTVGFDYDSDKHNITEGLRDLEMLAAEDQWDARDRALREADGRPVITVNRLIGPLKQIENEIRQTVPTVQVAPADSAASEGTATVFAGLFRQIQRQSRASWIYANATGHAAACGIGHMRVLTQYTGDDGFDQDITLDLIKYPFNVLWDAGAQKPDRTDAMRCTVFERMPRSQYKRRFGESAPADFSYPNEALNSGFQWSGSDDVTIAEYWRMVETTKKIGQLPDGRVVDLTNVKPMGLGMEIVREREVKTFKVKQVLMNGKELLSEDNDWAGRYIPIIPVIGHEIPQQRKLVRHGFVRFGRDPQRYFNFWKSASAEWIQQGPKSPFILTPAQIDGFEEMWAEANVSPRPYLIANVDPDAPGLQPRRMEPPAPPAAFWGESRQSAEDIEITTGVFQANMGRPSNEVSKAAIDTRVARGELTNFEYIDNLAFSLHHLGVVVMDLAQKVYDTRRIVRILDDEEREQSVPINVQVGWQHGEPQMVHDLTVGRYDVTFKIGPSQATRRAQTSTEMVDFFKINPESFAVAGDIVVEAQDWPNKKRIANRLRNAMDPAILRNDPDAPEPPPPPPEQEAAMQLEFAEQEGKVLEKQGKARLAHAKADREEVGVILDQVAARQPKAAGAQR